MTPNLPPTLLLFFDLCVYEEIKKNYVTKNKYLMDI